MQFARATYRTRKQALLAQIGQTPPTRTRSRGEANGARCTTQARRLLRASPSAGHSFPDPPPDGQFNTHRLEPKKGSRTSSGQRAHPPLFIHILSCSHTAAVWLRQGSHTPLIPLTHRSFPPQLLLHRCFCSERLTCERLLSCRSQRRTARCRLRARRHAWVTCSTLWPPRCAHL